MTSLRNAARALGICAVIAIAAATSVAQENRVEPLAPFQKLDPSGVTVSGISSGAFFAHQFHVAYRFDCSRTACITRAPVITPRRGL